MTGIADVLHTVNREAWHAAASMGLLAIIDAILYLLLPRRAQPPPPSSPVRASMFGHPSDLALTTMFAGHRAGLEHANGPHEFVHPHDAKVPFSMGGQIGFRAR